MEIFNVTGVIIIWLVALLIGFIIGGTYADHRRRKKEELEEQRKKDPMRGMTASEAYLAGFTDGEHYFRGSRQIEFDTAGFGEAYRSGHEAGTTKREAEADMDSR